jgi:hypothetical protein
MTRGRKLPVALIRILKIEWNRDPSDMAYIHYNTVQGKDWDKGVDIIDGDRLRDILREAGQLDDN